jgi:hypothetical protein
MEFRVQRLHEPIEGGDIARSPGDEQDGDIGGPRPLRGDWHPMEF